MSSGIIHITVFVFIFFIIWGIIKLRNLARLMLFLIIGGIFVTIWLILWFKRSGKYDYEKR